MNKAQEEAAYYAVITAPVRYDPELSSTAKLLYCEITSLCKQRGYCWATNSHFAELFGLSVSTISRMIAQLERRGHIKTETVAVSNGSERRIYTDAYCVERVEDTAPEGGTQKAQAPSGGCAKTARGDAQKAQGGGGKKRKQNDYQVNDHSEYPPYSPPSRPAEPDDQPTGDGAPAGTCPEDEPSSANSSVLVDKPRKRERFVPPTVEQVRAYCRERGNGIDPETFVDHYRNAARTLSYSPVVSADDIHLPRAPTELGGSVQFWRGSDLLMDAFALERTRDSLGTTIDVTAYDRGLYLTRNSDFLRVEERTPEDVTAEVCGKFGIPVGTLAATGVPLTRNFLGVSVYKIVMTMYTLASDQTGKEYRIRFRGSRLEVVEMAVSSQSLRLVPGSNLLSCMTKESASAMTNSVAIYDDRYDLISTQQDGGAVALYGLMQAAIRAGAYEDPEGHARQVLKENGLKTTITVNALGDIRLITGNTVVVEEPVTGVNGLFWIVSDSHVWQRGLYRTKLTLSLEGLMDKQTAGSVPTK